MEKLRLWLYRIAVHWLAVPLLAWKGYEDDIMGAQRLVFFLLLLVAVGALVGALYLEENTSPEQARARLAQDPEWYMWLSGLRAAVLLAFFVWYDAWATATILFAGLTFDLGGRQKLHLIAEKKETDETATR